MANKTDTEVLIGGKVYTLSGYESEEYMQRVASYINGKLSEFSKVEGYNRQSVDTQNVLLQLNIADDYFKAKQLSETLQAELDGKDKEVYDIKHDLVTAQLKIKSLEESLKELTDANNEYQKKIVRLETEIKASVMSNIPEEKATPFDDKEVQDVTSEELKDTVQAEVSDREVSKAAEKPHIESGEEIKAERAAESEEGAEQAIHVEPEIAENSDDVTETEFVERVSDAEVIDVDEFEEKLKEDITDDDFVQTIDSTAEFIHHSASSEYQDRNSGKKKHYGKRR